MKFYFSNIIFNLTRLYNYLTTPYENKALGKKTREPRFKTLKELIRDIASINNIDLVSINFEKDQKFIAMIVKNGKTMPDSFPIGTSANAFGSLAIPRC